MYFFDRADAGRRLGQELTHLKDEDVVVLALPRGGVPVGFEVAEALGAPLDVVMVRKLGLPSQPELGMGAIGEGGVRVINPEVVLRGHVSEGALRQVEEREAKVLQQRADTFRGDRPRVTVRGRTAVIVDDGIATGSTALAACQVVRALGAARIVLATPVAPPGALEQIKAVVDEVVCLESPEVFFAIGEFYTDFAQVPDEEVVRLLRRGRRDVPPRDGDVDVQAGGVTLEGRLSLSEGARGLVVFAHGSGSSRHSPRNRYVASVLHEAGLGTLLFDLLTPAEQSDRANVFDIPLLARRLVAAVEWVRGRPETADVRIGLFGASTGAAAALWAAAEPGNRVAAVVSRGGRPDLAAVRLAAVTAPTLLVVGGNDDVVLDLNRRAQALMRCETELRVVPGATHLFEEPGALEAVAGLARDWFAGHLTTGDPARAPQRA